MGYLRIKISDVIVRPIEKKHKFLITFPTGDLKEREKDKEVTPGSKDFCQL
ncbi:hypothetical protein BREVNS_2121 [Brevinematales bacterium NS]|nr:hypothetical protein BREVNS_2121 [Brevinematales bacterium NS]